MQSANAAEEQLNSQLESNFSKLNYVNKINILLKALMMERNKNYESQTRQEAMRQEYIGKVKQLAEITTENEELIEKVANGEILVEAREEELSTL